MSTARGAKQRGCAHVPLRWLARIGLWGDTRGWLRRCAPSFLLAQAMYGFVAQAINVAQTWGNFAHAAEFCVTLLQMLMTSVKLGCLLSNAVQIQEIVATLDEMHDAHARTDDVTHILQRTRDTSDKFARAMHAFCAKLLALLILILVVDGKLTHDIPFRRWYPYDVLVSPVRELTLVCYGLLSYIDYYTIFVFDLVVLCILIEVVGEFKVLQHRLKHIDRPHATVSRPGGGPDINQLGNGALKHHGDFDVGDMGAKKPRNFGGIASSNGIGSMNPFSGEILHGPSAHVETVEQRLVACVVHHHALIRLVSQLEETFQPALIIHLVCNFSVGLTLAFVTLQRDILEIKMLNILAIGTVCVIEFALYCYFCNQMTTESTLVGEALYACAWWDADAGFKGSMRIIQLFTNQPLFIRAATIFPMSMETFSKVMDTAYSMYNMMISTS